MSTTTKSTYLSDLKSDNGEITASVVEAAAVLAFRAAEPQEVEPGKIYVHATPDGHEIIDLLEREDHLAHPKRKRGTVTLTDAASFIAYVNAHRTPATVLYATVAQGRVVAVMDDHAAESAGAMAGWGQFRAVLQVAHTKEWQHWSKVNDRLVSQTEFAEHIEQGLEEIVQPPAAQMLEIAQHFEAHNRVEFKSVKLLADGSRQLRYEETVDAKAGQAGELVIPREFELGIAPYEGTEPYKVTARLRYRITNGALQIGYTLVRPHKVLEAAFDDILNAIGEETTLTPLRGVYGGVGV